jgi:release factor glutamine methyltransferase
MARTAKRETIRSQLIAARQVLTAAGFRNGWLDAEVLLGHVLRVDRAWLHAHPERPLTAAEGRRFSRLIDRRAAHQPVAYLTGSREFYGHLLRVSPAVLIPRPETELLVELAIDWLRTHSHARRVIDLGTGSGAVAIAIAKKVPAVRITAIDIAASALRVADRNLREHRLASRISLERGDLLRGASPADLIVANLPYVSPAQRRAADPELGYEPAIALGGGADGLDVIRRAVSQAPGVLRPGGAMLLECDPPQARRIERIATETWESATLTVHKDLAGRDRVVQIQLP